MKSTVLVQNVSVWDDCLPVARQAGAPLYENESMRCFIFSFIYNSNY